MTDDEARALDRQVALALGYTIYHYDKDYAKNCYYMLMTPNHEPAALGWHDGERRTEAEAWMDCPRFSTDIQAAWIVVEAMRAQAWQIQLNTNDYLYDSWSCAFFHHEHKQAVASGGTVQIAICRAAVAALDITTNHATDGA